VPLHFLSKDFEILDLDPPNNPTSHYSACHFGYNLVLIYERGNYRISQNNKGSEGGRKWDGSKEDKLQIEILLY